MLIRFFDILFSFIAMGILFPFMIPIMIGLKLTGEHYIFYLQPRVGKDGKCPKGTEACVKNASPENTMCYPPSDLNQMCPITSVDIVDTLQT